MIVLDTHVWLWWMSADARLSVSHAEMIEQRGASGIGISVMSCWEVAMLVSRKRIALAVPARQWIDDALTHPHAELLQLTPSIAVDAVQLPDPMHKDPIDRILVATAREFDCPLLTMDGLILAFPGVK